MRWTSVSGVLQRVWETQQASSVTETVLRWVRQQLSLSEEQVGQPRQRMLQWMSPLQRTAPRPVWQKAVLWAMAAQQVMATAVPTLLSACWW